jgi:hypothetical protein
MLGTSGGMGGAGRVVDGNGILKNRQSFILEGIMKIFRF